MCRDESASPDKPKRDFMMSATATLAAVGGAFAVWPLINSLNPTEAEIEAHAAAYAEGTVDLSGIAIGERATVTWQGKPIFIAHRTQAEIVAARAVDVESLPFPELDEERTLVAEWLVMVGICPRLGCVPIGQKNSDKSGDYGGWYCPCSGAHFDLSGRIRKGPSPKNLAIPKYEFTSASTIQLHSGILFDPKLVNSSW